MGGSSLTSLVARELGDDFSSTDWTFVLVSFATVLYNKPPQSSVAYNDEHLFLACVWESTEV